MTVVPTRQQHARGGAHSTAESGATQVGSRRRPQLQQPQPPQRRPLGRPPIGPQRRTFARCRRLRRRRRHCHLCELRGWLLGRRHFKLAPSGWRPPAARPPAPCRPVPAAQRRRPPPADGGDAGSGYLNARWRRQAGAAAHSGRPRTPTASPFVWTPPSASRPSASPSLSARRTEISGPPHPPPPGRCTAAAAGARTVAASSRRSSATASACVSASSPVRMGSRAADATHLMASALRGRGGGVRGVRCRLLGCNDLGGRGRKWGRRTGRCLRDERRALVLREPRRARVL